ncbi:nucleotidyl transferase AbiEii/AbiGii toxin family protein [bacterium]|nr:nucleotidyl transferase AbiEii/AbiGii toxin family protein [bacterium]
MINIDQINTYFPPFIAENESFRKYMLKEYIQLLILDFLSNSKWLPKLSFIGGTHLRLVKKIDRFSEDIDFDCKSLSESEFYSMTDDIIRFLTRFGYTIEMLDKKNPRLSAFRRNIYFPELLYSLKLSPHRSERFLIKIECEDQKIKYPIQSAKIQGCGLLFNFPIPSDPVMLSMKISALLSRAKGRDFYDVLFLSGITTPDYNFLKKRMDISNPMELKTALEKLLNKINLKHKSKDMEHLIFEKRNISRIRDFKKYFPLLHK